MLCLKGFFVFILLLVKSSQGSEIIDGSEVVPHSLPHMALLNSWGPICGGTLIDPKWVLTAAHCGCIRDVLLGVHSIKSKIQEEQYRQVHNVKRCVPHPCYNSETNNNDYMLLELDEPVKETKWVKSLNLKGYISYPAAGSACMVSGWGRTKPDVPGMNDVLMSAKVVAIDRNTCNSRGYYSHRPYITENMLCAGSPGQDNADTCSGDSGGPIVCNGTLVGVTSFGKGCGIKHKPGVYAFLTPDVLQWISNTMRKCE